MVYRDKIKTFYFLVLTFDFSEFLCGELPSGFSYLIFHYFEKVKWRVLGIGVIT